MSQGRGRPERYNSAVCQGIIANARIRGESLKQYCRDNNIVYITLIVALKRHGLSPRASVVAPVAAPMTEDETEQAIAEAEGDDTGYDENGEAV